MAYDETLATGVAVADAAEEERSAFIRRTYLHLAVAIGVFAGAITGARLAPRVRADRLRMGLIGVLILVAVQMLWKGITGT